MNGIVVVGSLFIDSLFTLEAFPADGETAICSAHSYGFGGKGGNQCVMAKLMGDAFLSTPVRMIARLGDDQFGRDYRAHLTQQHGVEASGVLITQAESTGIAIIGVQQQTGANRIFISRGAAIKLTASDLDTSLCHEQITKSRVIMLQNEIAMDTTCHALELANQHGLDTILNPSPLNAECADWLKSSFLTNHHRPQQQQQEAHNQPITVLCVNEVEAGQLWRADAEPIKSVVDAKLLLEGVINQDSRVRWSIITLGEDGAVIGNSDCKTVTHVALPQRDGALRVVDTTGAGDCFVGVIAFYLNEKHRDGGVQLEIEEIVRRAVIIASDSVTRHGTQTSYPSGPQIAALLQS